MSKDTHPITPSTLGIIEIIDRAFSVYLGHKRLFLGITIVYFLVDLLRELFFLFVWRSQHDGLVGNLVDNLLYALAIGVLLVGAREIYHGRVITKSESFARFVDMLPAYVGSTFLYLFFIQIVRIIDIVGMIDQPLRGIIALSYPLGIPFYVYFIIAWVLYGAVIVNEDALSISPLKRSSELVSGGWWRVLGNLITITILLSAMYIIFTLLFVFLFVFLGFIEYGSVLDIGEYVFSVYIEPNSVEMSLSFVFLHLLSVMSVFLTPVYAISVLLIYFNRRIVLEAYDVEMRVSM